jgi:prepilin-type N-terminal cleavage/methylation domain-containing protein
MHLRKRGAFVNRKELKSAKVSLIEGFWKKIPIVRLLNSKGFNLIELMIVVAIVGILAAVSVPLYINYIQSSRVSSLVYPGLHIIETNIGTHYAINGTMPPASMLPTLWAEADTTHFNVFLTGGALVIVIDSPANTSKLSRLHGKTMILKPVHDGLKIVNWNLSGSLANKLGINTD